MQSILDRYNVKFVERDGRRMFESADGGFEAIIFHADDDTCRKVIKMGKYATCAYKDDETNQRQREIVNMLTSKIADGIKDVIQQYESRKENNNAI